MIKIESATLQDAYEKAAMHFGCSVTELQIEVLQHQRSGFLGFFKKSAIIVASCKKTPPQKESQVIAPQEQKTVKVEDKQAPKVETPKTEPVKVEAPKNQIKESQPVLQPQKKEPEIKIFNNTILPESFVSDQDDEQFYEEELNAKEYKKIHNESGDKNYFHEETESHHSLDELALEVKQDINKLFAHTCFDINVIEVKVYDEMTLLVEITGEDSALLIGKEGYRYKALSYMIFNWINSKYQLQLRLEIAEFLKNQEESVSRYLVGVCETIERDGRAQTKILDGVLVQIALKQLRETYPEKYVAIRSTRDGLKFIIINDYNGY